jgi:hypothetical protein
VLTYGHHLGSGLHTEFVPGEDLTERPIAIQTLARDELIELYGEEPEKAMPANDGVVAVTWSRSSAGHDHAVARWM